MLGKFHYQYENFKGLVKERGFKSALNEAVYFNREIILVARDLNKPLPRLRQDFDMSLILLDKKELLKIEDLKFPDKARELKGRAYLCSGFAAFLGVIGKNIIAELWWTNSLHIRDRIIHPDLIWMKLDLKEDEIYGFDVFVAPEYRGTPAPKMFISSYMHELKRIGYSKIFGWIFKDNIPSAWLHRILSFKEIGRVKGHRFFFLEMKNGKLCF